MKKYTIKIGAFIIILIAGFILFGCQYAGQDAEQVVQAALNLKDLPPSISGITLSITAEDMDPITVENIESSAESVTVEVPAGLDRTFSLSVTAPDSSVFISYSGEVTEDLTAGEETDITISMEIEKIKLLIPDYSNNRIIQKTSFTSTDWIERKGTSLGFGGDSYFYPTDVDIDRYGNIYIASTGDTDSGIHKLENIEDTTPQALIIGYNIQALTVDRTNDRLYYADSSQYMYKSDLEGNELQSYSLSMSMEEVTGLAYGDGYLYIMDRNETQPTVYKYDPSGDGMVVDQYNDDNYLKAYWSVGYMDVMYKNGEVYVSSTSGETAGDYKILKLNTNLELIDYFGTFPTDEENPTEGEFFHPSRFIAVLNRKITVIDESGSDFPQAFNRLVSFSDLLGSEWETYGTSGTGTDQFTFFNYY